jgi:hypothetical protein
MPNVSRQQRVEHRHLAIAGEPTQRLADNGTNWYFQGSAFPQWPDALVSPLKGNPASAFQAMDESCLKVRPDSGKAAGGPGCRIG